MVRNHYCSFWLGGFETLEADKHLGWSWMSLMLKDDDLDTELEPMQTCQAGDFKETHRNTFFFPSLDQLFPISSLLVPHYWACFYYLMFLDGCCMVSWRHPLFVHPLHTLRGKCHLYDGCVWASLTACISLRVSQGSFPLAGLRCIKTAIRCNIIRRIYAGIYYLYQEGVWISIVYFQE